MSSYIALLNYTDKGIAHIDGSPERLDKARALLREMGGDFKQVFLTMGNFDMVVVYDAPDDATSARFSPTVGQAGLRPHDHAQGIPRGGLPRDHRTLGRLSRHGAATQDASGGPGLPRVLVATR